MPVACSLLISSTTNAVIQATEKSPPLGDCGARDARRALAMLLSCDVPDEDAVDAADARLAAGCGLSRVHAVSGYHRNG